ncbi:hypothetical protein KQ940_22245 [Marinobacterium sp. D7]|uniref:hypothetical protein n=1 Tax=Marinobacterium ramblicola TaxID=2849041 RepID=UPI001C2D47C9|nr:hypothetical protein [Marinobacterium ramblicola]MBV1790792.1 hypothetical protein [Marinobacterium ramblicola]
MKLLKIITVADESISRKDSQKMMESDSIIDLKKAGENYAIEKGVTEISWVDCTPPTMGDRKIADRNIKLTLFISDSEFLAIEK